MKKLLIILTFSLLFFAGCTTSRELKAKDSVISQQKQELIDKSEQLRICRDLRSKAEKLLQDSLKTKPKPKTKPVPKPTPEIRFVRETIYVEAPNYEYYWEIQELKGQLREKDKALLNGDKAFRELIRKTTEIKRSCS